MRAPLNLAGLLDDDAAPVGAAGPADADVAHAEMDEDGPQAETRIWGTDINVQTCADVFRSFLHFFSPQTARTSFQLAAEQLPHYRALLRDLVTRGENVLPLDLRHLLAFPATKQLHAQLLHFPQDIIPILDHVAHDEACALFAADGGADAVAAQLGGRRMQVRPFALPQNSRLRGLDPQHIETLVALQGLVVRVSSVVPDLKQAFFRCSVCGASVTVVIDRGKIAEPTSCAACSAPGAMTLVHNRCVFADKQLIRLQERPDEVPEGETPTTVSVFAYDDLVDALRPGDRVVVSGILRAVPRRQSSKQRAVLSVFRTFLDAIHFQRKGLDVSTDAAGSAADDDELARALAQEARDEARGALDDEDVAMFRDGDGAAAAADDDHDADDVAADDDAAAEAAALAAGASDDAEATLVRALFSREKRRQFRAFAARSDVYEVLLRSFAPSVYAMEDVKQGLLCLLFGGTYHRRSAAATAATASGNGNGNATAAAPSSSAAPTGRGGAFHMHQRGDINVLLCGDPGTSKSQLLSYVHQLSARGIYTSGRGSSAVGLTASVVRDPETRDTVLESGALVLSDRGVCCIDEFDKMSVGARAVLHEALEQQSVSVTKAGIVATLHARAAVLASANPAQSRYNPRMSVTDNLQLPPTLLSRFDLVFLVLDRADAEHDRRLARHLVSLYYDMDDALDAGAAGAGGAAGASASTATAAASAPATTATTTAAAAAAEDVTRCSVVSQQFLREFIQFARATMSPQLSAEAQVALVQHYLDLRHHHHFGGAGGAGGAASAMAAAASSLGGGMKVISATPRQLESLIRLSQARAKMRLSPTVSLDDVSQSVRLMRVATQSAATDPRTGLIDMDLLTTGRSLASKQANEQLQQTLLAVLLQLVGAAHATKRLALPQLRQEIQRHLSAQSAGGSSGGGGGYGQSSAVSGSDVEQAVRALEAEGVLQFVARTGTVIVRGGALSGYAAQHGGGGGLHARDAGDGDFGGGGGVSMELDYE